MIHHILTLHDFFSSIRITIIIRIHHKDSITFLVYCPLDLWQHTSKQKIILNTDRPCPNPCPDLPCPLNQNKCSLILIICPIFFPKFFSHINITFWLIFLKFRMLNLMEAKLIDHNLLTFLDGILSKKFVFLFVFLEIEWSLQVTW